MNFKDFLLYLENRLGYHQIPLNPAARDAKDIFESCPLHDDLTKQLVRSIYKRNRCQRLTDPVDRTTTESVLKEIRVAVVQEAGTDIDRYDFINDFCRAAHEFFVTDLAPSDSDSRSNPEKQPAQVVDLRAYRQRRMRWLA